MHRITSVPTPTVTPSLLHFRAEDALFVLSFVFVLLLALVAQVTFMNWRRWFPGAESEESLFGAVRAGVYTFMSHLS
jgi:light-harvesting complex 1 beta chain